MKRHRQWNNDIKYTPKSYDNLLPYDVAELLIAHRAKITASEDVLADRIGIYTWRLNALLERKILPNESMCKKIVSYLREVER
ncbi:phage protein [Streptococcus dysgalactiae subsp. equisimilis]|uniref:hypothetical protein n=1 Tax=Streptococcus dysgalactiae TaxID=1334 RepID=UPI0006180D8A|nr:hypothetical protein [Streptococcus dysgalactiae]KKC23187.1 hypothetical protein WH79_02900 [Streptococcus dysgalactiae subsp. equisimilis]VTT18324.1 phage protein [Streptococcus dysgalactiae subsp. equisimilis]VTT19294.1 phage protein [Streptococcus dysgalactiae subsp. equisimilis]VTT21700.1 phage protein [Streptococcus dysgalactiae subsp. equisimilis]